MLAIVSKQSLVWYWRKPYHVDVGSLQEREQRNTPFGSRLACPSASGQHKRQAYP
jgi:hypothetical protein